ncbi:nuclear transport factor 2 family protein [Thalassotalea atypica]|uniref:nuclear transport factor 2 family protein n=1 Tax=Thalassotalea atypica TaxID=2054316 RepID=UPI0025748079|nr:nuclear transport factor 2 family protein [Thalassotalea atypica]
MKLLHLITAVTLTILSTVASADDKSELNQLLDDFLANKVQDDLKNHQRFWANDLVYTSSSGTRFDKSVIIEGIKAEKNGKDEITDAPTYWAEETDIRLYGTTAIVAFKLQAKWKEDDAIKTQSYFNTGTLLKRDGTWQVVAWQATKIPKK